MPESPSVQVATGSSVGTHAFSGGEAEAALNLVPNAVHIGLFYYRGRVVVDGILPEGVDPVVILEGDPGEKAMSMRGKARLFLDVCWDRHLQGRSFILLLRHGQACGSNCLAGSCC